MSIAPTIPARINPTTFPAQVVAAGLGGIVYSCNPSGVFCAPADADALRPVVVAHNPDAPPPPAPSALPSSCSKLGLKRAFEEKGLWPTVRGMIASSADLTEDWNLAIELRISDPLIKTAVAALAQQGIALSDADVQALVTRANELVA